MGQYSKPHTKAWAAKIDSFDGYVFVTPEYNHGISGALKNAIDFLFAEWNNKAAGFVSYGSAGGARAVEQLRLVMAEVQIADRAQPGLALAVYRLRELQRLQAGCAPREVGQRHVRPGHRLGRRVEDAAEVRLIGIYLGSFHNTIRIAPMMIATNAGTSLVCTICSRASEVVFPVSQ